MQFHDYRTMKRAGFRGTTEEYINEYMMSASRGDRGIADSWRAGVECGWLRRSRPFYNVYPVVVDLCWKTSLNMKWGDILFPTRYIAIRFAAGHEPLGICNFLARVPSEDDGPTMMACHESRVAHGDVLKRCPLACVIKLLDDEKSWFWMHGGKDIRDHVVADCIADDSWSKAGSITVDEGVAKSQTDFIVHLLAFIGLLARGTDLITPAILSKDRAEYDATGDESRRRWLEQRAAKRLGGGFDIGRSLEIERATSPHWRSPHLALFHTGPGRTVPMLKIRSGCVVIPKDMSSVPTGYLGEEKPGEVPNDLKSVNRTKIPHGLRIKIFDRDGRRCRCCGKAAEDGVTLEVDHIDPKANGGNNDEDNLWVLCRPCNSGKSDRLLQNIKPFQDEVLANGI